MSFEHGTLVQWNDERGFGFLKPDLENSQVFVHIKAFGPLARRPVIGDRIWFDSTIGEQGKRKATVARITEATPTGNATTIRSDPSAKRSTAPKQWSTPKSAPRSEDWSSSTPRNTGYRGARRRYKSFLLLILLPIAGISWISSRCSSSAPSTTPTQLEPGQEPQSFQGTGPTQVPSPGSSASFQCTGKEHCTQMSSKEEAQYYLAHCPNVMIDGDGDGVACEGEFGH
jgi:cold shock CspA family protein